MIDASKYYRKFLSGGAVEGSILELLQQLPQEQKQLFLKAFALWAQLKGIDINQLQLDPNAMELALLEFVAEQLATQVAKYGTKIKKACVGKKLNTGGELQDKAEPLLPSSKHLKNTIQKASKGCGCKKMLHRLGGRIVEICE